jgi:hypothetical protein
MVRKNKKQHKANQIKLFIAKCDQCDDTGILYMWTRENLYTIPIYCDCEQGSMRKEIDNANMQS